MAVVIYSDIKHKVLGNFSNGTFSYVDEDITALFNDAVGESTSYKVSPNDPYNKVTGKFTPQIPISRFEIRVNPIEDTNYGPDVGNLLFSYQGALVSRTYPFTFLVSTASFNGSQSGIYRICLLAQKEVDHSWDYTQIFTVLNATKTAYLNYKTIGHDAFEVLGGNRVLPYEYQRVEYIEGTGSQYIELDFSPTATTKVEYKMKTSASQTVSSAPLLGTRVGSSNNNRFFPLAYSGTTGGRMTFGATEHVFNINSSIIYEGIFDAKNQTATLNNQTYSLTGNSFSKSEDTKFCIFGTNGYGTNHYIAKGACYYCKIYENDKLTVDLIPCYRKSDGEIGLFDLISGKFYIKTGSGAFAKGPVMQIPLEYQQVEYIQSSGTQYINTNYYWQSEVAQIYAQLMITSQATYRSIWGNEEYVNGSTSTSYFGIIPHGGNNDNYSIYVGSGSPASINIPAETRVTLEANTTSDKKITVKKDGTTAINAASYSGTIQTYSVATAVTNNTGKIFIFANHNSGTNGNTSTGTQTVAGMRLFRFKMWDNDRLVRDFVPCYRKLDNMIGLYDLAEGVFYTNSGTGSFTRGDAV